MKRACKHTMLLFFLTLVFPITAQCFVIKAGLVPRQLPNNTLGYVLEPKHMPQGRAEVIPEMLSVEVSKMLNIAGRSLEMLHPDYNFVFAGLEPISYNKQGLCIARCPSDTGPRANLMLEYEINGRRYNQNAGTYIASRDKVKGDFLEAGNIEYEIKNIVAPLFRERTFLLENRSQSWYVAQYTEGPAELDFCIRFAYRDPYGKVIPASDSRNPCVDNYAEFYKHLLVENARAFHNFADGMLASASNISSACSYNLNKETELFEVSARPDQDAVRRFMLEMKSDAFGLSDIKEKNRISFNLSGFRTEDTNRNIYGTYAVELTSFAPKILASSGAIVEVEGIPYATIKLTDTVKAESIEKKLEYYKDEPAEATYSFSSGAEFIVRFYQRPEEIEMPYFIDNSGNGCKSNCDFVSGARCYDAGFKFAIKIKKNDEANPKYTWYLRTKKELERLNLGPNLTVAVTDQDTGTFIRDKNVFVRVVFADPLTMEEYAETKKADFGIAKFNVPLNTPLLISAGTGENFIRDEVFEIKTLADYTFFLTLDLNSMQEYSGR